MDVPNPAGVDRKMFACRGELGIHLAGIQGIQPSGDRYRRFTLAGISRKYSN